MRIAFVGKRAKDKRSAANYLVKKYKYKRMRLDDGIVKYTRDMYMYRKHERVTWETRVRMYDALYKLDPEMHIDYLLRRLARTTRDVVTDDPRYINEVLKLKDAGYILVRVSPGERTNVHLSGMKSAAAGTVKLQEYFGYHMEAYPVDYSVVNESLEKLRRSIDKIVDKENAKLLESSTGSNDDPKEEEIWQEREVRT